MLRNCSGEPIERAIVVANPKATHAKRMQRQLKRLDLPQEIIETKPDPRYARDELLKAAAADKIIFGAGGDGTTHHIANTILSPAGSETGLRWLPFVPLRGGNANDIAHMLNGRHSPNHIVKHGSHAWLSPLEVTVTDDEGNQSTRYALGYFSVGATAAAAERLDAIKNTANRFTKAIGFQALREAVSVWHTVATAPVFMSREDEGRLLHPVGEHLFLRGNRIAKYGRPHARLGQKAYELVTAGDKNHLSAIADMLKMQQGKLYGIMADEMSFTVLPTGPGAPEISQMYDGESAPIAYGSQVSVSIAGKGEAWHTLTTQQLDSGQARFRP